METLTDLRDDEQKTHWRLRLRFLNRKGSQIGQEVYLGERTGYGSKGFYHSCALRRGQWIALEASHASGRTRSFRISEFKISDEREMRLVHLTKDLRVDVPDGEWTELARGRVDLVRPERLGERVRWRINCRVDGRVELEQHPLISAAQVISELDGKSFEIDASGATPTLTAAHSETPQFQVTVREGGDGIFAPPKSRLFLTHNGEIRLGDMVYLQKDGTVDNMSPTESGMSVVPIGTAWTVGPRTYQVNVDTQAGDDDEVLEERCYHYCNGCCQQWRCGGEAGGHCQAADDPPLCRQCERLEREEEEQQQAAYEQDMEILRESKAPVVVMGGHYKDLRIDLNKKLYIGCTFERCTFTTDNGMAAGFFYCTTLECTEGEPYNMVMSGAEALAEFPEFDFTTVANRWIHAQQLSRPGTVNANGDLFTKESIKKALREAFAVHPRPTELGIFNPAESSFFGTIFNKHSHTDGSKAATTPPKRIGVSEGGPKPGEICFNYEHQRFEFWEGTEWIPFNEGFEKRPVKPAEDIDISVTVVGLNYRAGDVVYEKLSGRGPWVLLEKHPCVLYRAVPAGLRDDVVKEEQTVLDSVWTVRDRHGKTFAVPEPMLTRDRPFSIVQPVLRVLLALLNVIYLVTLFPLVYSAKRFRLAWQDRRRRMKAQEKKSHKSP